MTAVRWICCQLGAREHYAVPRALRTVGLLDRLETDVWFSPGSAFAPLVPKTMAERTHHELCGATVGSRNASAIAFELGLRLQDAHGWYAAMRRNKWFQESVVRSLKVAFRDDVGPRTLFSYSYAALDIFRFAKERGWTTVLGQIDPGPAEDRLVAKLHRDSPHLPGDWQPAPEEYWRSWREECSLADTILVNSEWSRDLLVQEGVAESQFQVIPLAYDPQPDGSDFVRDYPDAFTSTRPLRVLVLGQVNLRKGFAAIVEAMALLRTEPVEFWFVGAKQISTNPEPGGKWFGAVPRSEVAQFLRDADVLLFPTISDGFGLVQLEAQAWGLPVIASRNCGRVVTHGVNGTILDAVTGISIAVELRRLASSPKVLAAMSAGSADLGQYSVARLGSRLMNISPAKN